MIPAVVDYVRPSSLEGALEALSTPDAKVLAGGQSLIPAMKLRIARPSIVVDIGGLDLAGIEERDGELAIGALTTWDELERSVSRPELRAIGECAARIGDLQVRNRGTLAGGLAHADPAADMPAVMLALGATLHVRSPDGERTVGAGELATGPFTTSLSERELIAEVRVPVPARGSGSAYAAVEHPASGFALAGAAALVRPDEVTRIAVTGVAAAPFLVDDDDDELEGAQLFDDRYAPAEYRRQLARTVIRRAVERAEQRAAEDAR